MYGNYWKFLKQLVGGGGGGVGEVELGVLLKYQGKVLEFFRRVGIQCVKPSVREKGVNISETRQ